MNLLKRFVCFLLVAIMALSGAVGGINDEITAAQAASLEIVQIAAGRDHSLALLANGDLYTWGNNSHGQLGDGTNRNKNYPVKIGTGFTKIAAGSLHNLALKGDALYAWGYNELGSLGDGSNISKNIPVKVGAGFTQISAGYFHSLALKGDVLYAWGYNDSGQLGDGTNKNKNVPAKIDTGFTQISAGSSYNLALKGNALYAWGYNDSGQLGDGTNKNKNVPIKIDKGFTQISAGTGHSLALKGNTLYAWGNNDAGALGDGTNINKTVPKKIDTGFTQISAGSNHSIALKDSALYTWGRNVQMQLGDGTNVDKYTPVKIDTGYTQISAGTGFNLALKENFIYGWGFNGSGQLGKLAFPTNRYYCAEPTKIEDIDFYDSGDEETPDGNGLQIISFDWTYPNTMTAKGTSTTNGIKTYVFETTTYTHKLNMTVTKGAEWALYSDEKCTKEVKKTSAQTYEIDKSYTLYIKLTKAGFDDAIYGLKITRRASPPTTENSPPPEAVTFTDDGRSVGMKFDWSLDYFNETSFGYKNELAIAALILSGQAENSQSKAETALKQLQLWDGNEAFVDSRHYGSSDIGVARTIALKKYNDFNIITIVIRGTTDIGDGITDAVHWGFESAAGGICNDVRGFLKALGISIDNANNRFFVVGHSLGGAAANLLAAKLVENGAKQTSTFGYTFASPYTVSWIFHDRTQKYIYNVLNTSDIVVYWSPMGPFAGARFGIDISYRDKSQGFRDAYFKLRGAYWSDDKNASQHATRTYMAFLLENEKLSYDDKNLLITVH